MVPFFAASKDKVLSLNSCRECFKVSLDECHLDHSGEVDGGFFVSREDAASFLQPADLSFDNVPLAIVFFVKFHRASVAIFVRFRWDDWCDPHFQKHLVDPVSTVPLVARDRDRPCDRFAVSGCHIVINAIE